MVTSLGDPEQKEPGPAPNSMRAWLGSTPAATPDYELFGVPGVSGISVEFVRSAESRGTEINGRDDGVCAVPAIPVTIRVK